MLNDIILKFVYNKKELSTILLFTKNNLHFQQESVKITF